MWAFTPIELKSKFDVPGSGHLYGPVLKLFVSKFNYEVHEKKIIGLNMEYEDDIYFNVIDEDKVLISTSFISFVVDYEESFQEAVRQMIESLGPKHARKMEEKSKERRKSEAERLYEIKKEIQERN
jgi:hypothetical protein